MNAVSEFDLGSLSWVKPEIDLALERATEALTHYAGSNELTQLKLARTQIHQVHGALLIMTLDGITQISESLEALLILLEEGQLTANAPIFDAFEISLTAIRQYLDDLLAGMPQQALRLLPAYQVLAAARGLHNAHPADLFYPALSSRPDEQAATETALAPAPTPALDPEAHKALLKRERAQFQKALLTFLKKPEEMAQAQANLRQAIAAVEAVQDDPAHRTFWEITLAFIDSLAVPAIAADPRARQLCSQIDGQLRRWLEGNRTVSERLRRDALYFVAQTPAGNSAHVDKVQDRFALLALLPTTSSLTIPAQKSPEHEMVWRRLRETLTHCEKSWGEFCAGKTGGLSLFVEQVRQCQTLTGELAHTDMKRLGQAFAALATWLAEQPARNTESVAMEVATTILLLQKTQANFTQLSSDFPRQVDLMVARLYGCISGKQGHEQGLPALDEITRQAQEKRVISRVAREISNNLRQIEQHLEAFFRDPGKTTVREGLEALDVPLKQIAGALTMLGHFDAVADLKSCTAQIKRFAAGNDLADLADFEKIAGQLSQLGFFAEALTQGASSYQAFLGGLHEKVLDTPANTEAEKNTSRRIAQPVPAKLDNELLGIFLEEAHRVLASLAKQLAALKESPHQMDALSIIRRGTHTLKGSSRMVGLHDFGEIAWEIEQTLNQWLRQEQAVNADLLKLLADEHKLFSLWLNYLESGIGAAPDALALVQLAQQLRGAEALAHPPSVIKPTPAPELPVSTTLSTPTFTSISTSNPILTTPELAATADALADLLSTEDTPPEGLTELPAAREIAPILRSTAEIEAIPATLYEIFQAEARTHLQTLLNALADLQAQPTLPTPFAMTRAAHTLGGTAGTVGLMPLKHLAHALEEALLRRDASADPASASSLTTLGQTIDCLASQFGAQATPCAEAEQVQRVLALAALYPAMPPAVHTTNHAESDDASRLQEVSPPQDALDEQLLPLFLNEAEDQLDALCKHLLTWRELPEQPESAHAIARLLHNLKGNARLAGAMTIGELTHRLESQVAEALALKQVPANIFDAIESAVDTLAASIAALQPAPAAEAFIAPGQDEPLPNVSDPENPQTASSLRVPAKLLDQLVNEAGELSIARTRVEGEMRSLKSSLVDLTENVSRLRGQLREVEIEAEGQIQAHIAPEPEGETSFDPLELDRYTRFQELTRFMAESVNDVTALQQNLLKHVDDANAAILAQSRLNRNLQQELMGMRMLPFASQSERLCRVVRQTAKELGKQANLEIVGAQVEIDRSVLDRIVAPLEHMLRNAVTHGIESPAQRVAAGKAETGEISLSLVQEGNEIILSLIDDGQGLDTAAIRQRAESLGLLTPGQAIEEAALFDFIFQPGFSTASELSQVAGRGIGMDVAKTDVNALGGRIKMISSPGQGTTFRLYLPLTLAVMQTVLVRTGNRLYAIPSTLVEQVLELKAAALAELREKGEAAWMGKRYPYYFLPHLLGEPSALPEAHRQHWVLLLRAGQQHIAVLVDELQGNQEVVLKQIGEQLARVGGIDGATVLGDGRVVLILNPLALASRISAPYNTSTATIAESPCERSAEALAQAPLAPKLTPSILVVDDSLTVRKILSRLLTREGYQVVLAKDGVDALEQLQEKHQEVLPLLVLCDVEMPRMDGFDLIRNIRADTRWQALPIIMITSRTADKHRQHALELGANHYLGKPYDETELLQLIAGYEKERGLN